MKYITEKIIRSANISKILTLVSVLFIVFIGTAQPADASVLLTLLGILGVAVVGGVASAVGVRYGLSGVGEKMMSLAGDLIALLTHLAETFTNMTAWWFEFSIELSINLLLPVLINSDWVGSAWVAFRDLANLFFIFILLYIAIGTILQLSQVDTKRMLTKVIIIALILNFSGFFTKIVIDATNVLAYDFYTTIKNMDGEGSGKNLSSIITRISTGNKNEFEKIESAYEGEGKEAYGTLMKNLFLLIAYILLIWVFLAGGILLLIRSLVLIFVYILSPLAFFALIIPGQEKYFSEWWHKLTSNALVAPVYLFFIVVFMNMVNSGGITELQVKFQEIFEKTQDSGSVSWALYSIAIHFASFMIAYGILVGGMIASVKMGAVGAKVSGLAGAAVTGWAISQTGRQTLGRAGSFAGGSEKLKEKAKEGGVGGALARTGLRSSNWMSKRSFDPRSTPVVGKGMQDLASSQGLDLGKSVGEGGRKKIEQDKVDKKVKKEKEFMESADMNEKEKKDYLETNITERFKRSWTDLLGILGKKNAKERAKVREQMIGGTKSPSEQEEKVQNVKARYDTEREKVKAEKQYDRRQTEWENKEAGTDERLRNEREELRRNEAMAANPNTNDPKGWKRQAEQNKQEIDGLLKEREEARKAVADIEDDLARLDSSEKVEINKIKKGGKKKTNSQELAEELRRVIEEEGDEATPPPTPGEEAPRTSNDEQAEEDLLRRFENNI